MNLPLELMSLADKLALMETLWTDLSKQPEELPSPDWHHDVLLERKMAAEKGELQFIDWDQALHDLKGELREDSPS